MDFCLLTSNLHLQASWRTVRSASGVCTLARLRRQAVPSACGPQAPSREQAACRLLNPPAPMPSGYTGPCRLHVHLGKAVGERYLLLPSPARPQRWLLCRCVLRAKEPRLMVRCGAWVCLRPRAVDPGAPAPAQQSARPLRFCCSCNLKSSVLQTHSVLGCPGRCKMN